MCVYQKLTHFLLTIAINCVNSGKPLLCTADICHNRFMRSEFIEAFMAGAFITIVSLTFAGFCGAVSRIIRLGWKGAKLKRFEYAVLPVGLLGLLCIVYGFIEPMHLETTHVSIKSKKLAPGTKPIRIVHITDLHCSFAPGVDAQLPTVIDKLRPDLVVFTGDAANDKVGVGKFIDLMKQLATIAPTYCVRGNHDYKEESRSLYDKSDARFLDEGEEARWVRGVYVWIAGIGVGNDSHIEPVLSRAPADAFTIFLYHYPVGLRAAVSHKIDLFCGGHTHGGQIRLPWYGAILTNSELGKEFEYGLYKVADTSIFISRGVGMIGIPVRFLAPPEVAVIDVCPESQ